MLTHPERGLGRRSIITGESTQPKDRKTLAQCIFRMSLFLEFLEDTGILDVDDVLDLYTLHYVFLPLIQSN